MHAWSDTSRVTSDVHFTSVREKVRVDLDAESGVRSTRTWYTVIIDGCSKLREHDARAFKSRHGGDLAAMLRPSGDPSTWGN